MDLGFILPVALSLVALLLAIIGPRNVWWATAAWQYRDPKANEPSDAAFGFHRVALAITGAGGLIFAAGALISNANRPDSNDHLQEVARHLEVAGPITIESFSRYSYTSANPVEEAVQNALSEAGTYRLNLTRSRTAVPDKQYLFSISDYIDETEYCLELSTTARPTEHYTEESTFDPPSGPPLTVPSTLFARRAFVAVEVFDEACTTPHSPPRW